MQTQKQKKLGKLQTFVSGPHFAYSTVLCLQVLAFLNTEARLRPHFFVGERRKDFCLFSNRHFVVKIACKTCAFHLDFLNAHFALFWNSFLFRFWFCCVFFFVCPVCVLLRTCFVFSFFAFHLLLCGFSLLCAKKNLIARCLLVFNFFLSF